MIRKHLWAAARRARWAVAVGTAVVAPLTLACSALAAPSGEFAVFSQCPLSNPSAVTCLYAVSSTGEFKIGSTAVPLSKPVILQGGLTPTVEGFSEILPAANGETLVKTPETVPGGLLKVVAPKFLPGFLQELFNEFIDKGITGVTATTELVGKARVSPANILSTSGTGLELPVRVHLENTFLGSGCYVGSASHPVTVDLISGTTSPPAPNTPITGAPGTLGIAGGGSILQITGNKLVNNSFAAPEAEGCGGLLSFLIDPAVDAEVGLPSAAGHNTAILAGTQELASVKAVAEH